MRTARQLPPSDKPGAVAARPLDAVDVKITRLSPDDEAGCADAVAVLDAAAQRDCPEVMLPTPRGFANMLRYGWDLDPQQGYLARDDDGTPIGVLVVAQPTY